MLKNKFQAKHYTAFLSLYVCYHYSMQAPPPATNGPVIAGYFVNWYAARELHFISSH